MNSERVALVVGHADEPEMLERNLRHHLGMGAGPIVVSTIGADDEAAAVCAQFAAEGVRHRIADVEREDVFDYFSLAARDIRDDGDVDWIGFIDTDEFIVSASGKLEFPYAPLRELYAIPRYNAVVQRLPAGTLAEPRLDDPANVVVAVARERLEDGWAHGDTRLAYSDGADVSAKVVVRTRLTEAITLGGHGIRTSAPFVERAIARDMAIVHAPFTTLKRFLRKVEMIHVVYRDFGHRLPTWHWPYWLKMNEDELAEEFEKQIFGEHMPHKPPTFAIGDVIARGRSNAALPTPPEWYMLARTIEYRPSDAGDELEEPAAAAVAAETVDRLTYLTRYGDLAAAAQRGAFDAAGHFAAHGLAEGRVPSYEFETAHVTDELCRRLAADIHPRETWWLYFAIPENERFAPNAWFDAKAYCAMHPQLDGASGWVAFADYRRRVFDEELSPNEWFSEAGARKIPAVAQAIERGMIDSAFHYHYAATCAGRDPLAEPSLL